jgi:hypothetical protein
MNKEEFRQFCREKFSALCKKYNLIENKDYHDDYSIIFENKTTRIKIEGIHYGFGIDVRLSSIDPQYMKHKTYCFDDVLILRAPELKLIQARNSDTTDIQKEQIDQYATALDKYGDDILKGDFTIFPRLAQAIDDRIKQFEK